MAGAAGVDVLAESRQELEDKRRGQRLFDLFEEGNGGETREAVARLLRHFTEEELLDEGVLWKDSPSGAPGFRRCGFTEALQTLWNGEKFAKRARTMLEEWSQELEAREATGTRRDGDKARVGEVCRALKLGEAERGLLEYALVRQRTVFDDFPLHGPKLSGRVRTTFLAMAVDCPESEVEKALSPGGALRKHDVLDDEGDLARGPFREYLEGCGPMALEGRFYKRRDTKDALPWAYFGALAKNHGTVLKRLLKAADGRGGANVLLYGEPGTGKTSFALALARELGMTLYEILQGTRDGEKVEAQSRMTGIFLCNERAPKPGSMALVDEADELLRSRGGGFFGLFSGFGGGGVGGTEKGAVNSLLDGTKIPTVWIVNAPPESIDGSVRRRFDYSVRFDKLTDAQRRAVWRNTVAKTGLAGRVGEEQIAEWSRKWRTSAGGIATVLGNVRRMRPKRGEEAALVAKLMRPHCELAVAERPGAGEEGVARDYSLEGLNIRGAVGLDRVVGAVRRFREALEGAEAGDPDRPRMNLLLWGPPGTGKTEFVKHLGAVLDAPVAARSGSDLLSMWVGGTERNIRAAFEEAEGSILFLDEIDGLLQNRAGAVRSWEVTQVNELLQRMEMFRGVMVAATNFMDNLDPAVLRRFTFKLQFDYLTDEGKRLFFERMFGTRLDAAEAARLARIPCLAPGDYRTARQSLHYLGGEVTNAMRLDALERESALKKGGTKGRIGF
ncbi:MAG: AAA family ATPase [Kiritimatiellae bacterium]|nr:AAA family ATPase [Kiritimatiellia bacterium]